MDAAFVETMKGQLLAEQKELEDELMVMTTKAPGSHVSEPKFPNVGDSEGDSETEVDEFRNEVSMEKDLEHALANVKNALARMEAGKYGTCETCGDEIGEERLRANPSATHCVEHAA